MWNAQDGPTVEQFGTPSTPRGKDNQMSTAGPDPFAREQGRLSVDVWSDVVCPFCYMGDAILEQALEKFPHRDAVDVRYHSFELMPELPADSTTSPHELLATKRGIPREQVELMHDQVTARAAELGLDYRFDQALTTNTTAAHRLSHFAAAHGRQHAMVQRLFRAYFTDGLNIGDYDVLADLAADVGLDRASALAALASGEFSDEVASDIALSRELGISGVPFFVFNGKFAVSGAQPVEAFLQVLDTAWKESADD